MFDDRQGTFVELDLGFVPYPSGGGLTLFQREERHDAFLILYGYAPDLCSPDRTDAIALVTVVGVVQSVFGYPNEEAFWKDPRGDVGAGIFELVASQWKEAIDNYNSRTYGSDLNWPPELPPVRHFFIGSKDVSAQFLAREVKVETFTADQSAWVPAEALRRLEEPNCGQTIS